MIPRARDITSSELIHRPADLFNPPALTNFLGCVQADVDPIGIRNLNFPPFACSNVPTANLFLDDRLFASLGEPVSFRWRPDRIDREARAGGLAVTSKTALVAGETAAVVTFELRNLSGIRRTIRLRVALAGSLVKQMTPWFGPLPPSDPANDVSFDRSRGALVFSSSSGAVGIQGITGAHWNADSSGLSFEVELEPGEVFRGSYIYAIGETVAEAGALYDRVAADPGEQVSRAEREWDAELESVFTPGNDRYSGSMPVLVTGDKDLLRLYHIGILGVVYFKRETQHSVIGRTYDTLMPRYWQSVTFLWDYSLSSLVHAMLDPDVMRIHLEKWMSMDIHQLYGSEWLTGGPMGQWYSVNDHAMCSMIHRYLSWSGDTAWLQQPNSSDGQGRKPIEFLKEYATAWRGLDRGSGLADYGGILNLLECVSTYVNEVASLNAANVWNLRAAAEVFDVLSEDTTARDLRRDADVLKESVRELYADGRGWWHARMPDGRLQEVRHCYDFLMVSELISDDLSPQEKKEMGEFFSRELMTPEWMHSLSPGDPDATFSVRPDHQWNGAYTAWPARTAAGLFRLGRADLASEWIKGLAKTANQGPFGQAHFVDGFAPLEDGGALKASAEFPYINDWACSSGGAWAELFVSTLFGVRVDMKGTITAEPQIETLDPDASLDAIPYRDRLYSVDRGGLKEQK